MDNTLKRQTNNHWDVNTIAIYADTHNKPRMRVQAKPILDLNWAPFKHQCLAFEQTLETIPSEKESAKVLLTDVQHIVLPTDAPWVQSKLSAFIGKNFGHLKCVLLGFRPPAAIEFFENEFKKLLTVNDTNQFSELIPINQ